MVDYSHQEECLSIMEVNNVGKIILPTGSGKSRIEFEYAKSKLIRNDGIHQIVIIVAPRIILCQQLLNNFYCFMVDKYKDMDLKEFFTFVSSGVIPSIKINGKIISGADIGKSTTSINEIAHDIRLAFNNKSDSIVFSTYKSFDRCIFGIKKGIKDNENNTKVYLIADEAHYFTRVADDKDSINSFRVLKDNLNMFDARFFLTATPKIRNDGDEDSSGMENSLVYGEDIYIKEPKHFISNGVICEPRLHKVIMPDYINQDNFDEHLGDILLRSFWAHEKVINEFCMVGSKKGIETLGLLDFESKNKGIGGKVLVAVSGSKQLDTIINNGFCDRAKNRGINVAWTMSEQDIGTYYNGKKLKIDEFLYKINDLCYKDGKLKNSVRLVLLHYDQLTEGIDIPSMTGLMVLRDMNKVKKVQNIGRVLRSHPDDHNKNFDDRDTTWIKPYSYVIVPKLENISRFDNLIEQLTNEYDAKIEIETPAFAIGISEEQPELQNFEHKAISFKSVSGKILHNIEYFNEWREKIKKQIDNDEEIYLTF